MSLELSPPLTPRSSSSSINHDFHETPECRSGREKTLQIALKKATEHVDAANIDDYMSQRACLVGDMGEVYRQHKRWKQNLPRVNPHYAVKCNPDPVVLQLLAESEAHFDCASMPEIETVLAHGVHPAKIIFAHPRKEIGQARAAIRSGVFRMTTDSEQDLANARDYFPEAEFLVRISTDDSGSKCQLGSKFGAGKPFDTPQKLLRIGREWGLKFIGVSFHIGSNSSDPSAFIKAVADSRAIFDFAAEIGYDFKVLDVGGGFTSSLFEEMADRLNGALAQYFPSPTVEIIGEPGRFYVGSAYVLAAQVTGIRSVDDPHDGVNCQYDINEGNYGLLASTISDHQEVIPRVLRKRNSTYAPKTYRVFGPTCDAWDKPVESYHTFDAITYGDWVFFEGMGAYTYPCATEFNGNPKAKAYHVSSEKGASDLLGWAWDVGQEYSQSTQ